MPAQKEKLLDYIGKADRAVHIPLHGNYDSEFRAHLQWLQKNARDLTRAVDSKRENNKDAITARKKALDEVVSAAKQSMTVFDMLNKRYTKA